MAASGESGSDGIDVDVIPDARQDGSIGSPDTSEPAVVVADASERQVGPTMPVPHPEAAAVDGQSFGDLGSDTAHIGEHSSASSDDAAAGPSKHLPSWLLQSREELHQSKARLHESVGVVAELTARREAPPPPLPVGAVSGAVSADAVSADAERAGAPPLPPPVAKSAAPPAKRSLLPAWLLESRAALSSSQSALKQTMGAVASLNSSLAAFDTALTASSRSAPHAASGIFGAHAGLGDATAGAAAREKACSMTEWLLRLPSDAVGVIVAFLGVQQACRLEGVDRRCLLLLSDDSVWLPLCKSRFCIGDDIVGREVIQAGVATLVKRPGDEAEWRAECIERTRLLAMARRNLHFLRRAGIRNATSGRDSRSNLRDALIGMLHIASNRFDHVSRDMLLRDRCLDVLLQLTRDESHQLQELSAATLGNLLDGDAKVAEAVASLGGERRLRALLVSPDAPVQSMSAKHACRALCNLQMPWAAVRSSAPATGYRVPTQAGRVRRRVLTQRVRSAACIVGLSRPASGGGDVDSHDWLDEWRMLVGHWHEWRLFARTPFGKPKPPIDVSIRLLSDGRVQGRGVDPKQGHFRLLGTYTFPEVGKAGGSERQVTMALALRYCKEADTVFGDVAAEDASKTDTSDAGRDAAVAAARQERDWRHGSHLSYLGYGEHVCDGFWMLWEVTQTVSWSRNYDLSRHAGVCRLLPLPLLCSVPAELDASAETVTHRDDGIDSSNPVATGGAGGVPVEEPSCTDAFPASGAAGDTLTEEDAVAVAAALDDAEAEDELESARVALLLHQAELGVT